MWVLVTIAGLAVEVAVIVLLGRSVTRRDDEVDRDRPGFTTVVDEARGTIVARGRFGRTGADLLRGAAESLRDCGHQRITVELPEATTGDPASRRLLTGLADELSTTGLRMRLEWSAQTGPPGLGLIPELRRGDRDAARRDGRRGPASPAAGTGG